MPANSSAILGKNWKEWLRVHHAIDWVVVVVLFVTSGIMSVYVEPFQRFLPEGDPDVNYPTQPSIVPLWLLLVIAVVLPLVLFGLTQIWHHSRHDFHHATLGVLTSFAITNFITTVVKLSTGRYRPDYLINVATQESDGRMSFPSGHSSLSFSSMVFLSLYLAGKFQIYRVHSGSLVLKALAIVSPITISTFVAISRVIDYHHDFSDIIAGAVLGSGVAIMAYFLWYPSLFSRHPDKPRMHPRHDMVRYQTVDPNESRNDFV